MRLVLSPAIQMLLVTLAPISCDETVCDELTVYVPFPPVPLPRAVIFVPGVTLVFARPSPISVCPTASVPEVTAVTVSVVPAIEPVTIAAGGLFLVGAGQMTGG